MANVKISGLPAVTSLNSSDVLPSVAGSSTSKITVQNLANSLTQVSSSISASFSRSGSYSVTSSYATTASYSLTASYALNAGAGTVGGSGTANRITKFTAGTTLGNSNMVDDGTNVQITGSLVTVSGSAAVLVVTGSIRSTAGITGSLFGTASYVSGGLFTSTNPALSSSYTLSGSYTVSSSYALSSSYSFSSSYSVTASYSVSASYALSSSYAISASLAQTASSVNNLVQNVLITGSLVVSGSNGSGIFSQGITMIDYVSGISTSGSYRAWRAPFSCSVVALYGYRLAGSAATVNAARSGSSGYGKHSSSDVTLTNDNVWTAASSIQNANYNAGDSLEIIITGSTNNQIAVQVDFIKKF